jgi:branched-subunit amino acid aminotransferase/4-amino-4-deoxychorismate lyase
MSEPGVLRWRAGRLEPRPDAPAPHAEVLAADSWLLRDGAALALDAHRARFLGSVPADVVDDATAFWDAAIAALPRTGAWFPRLDLRADGGLLLHLRPAPELRRDIALVTWEGEDPRRVPGMKGPDLGRLAEARQVAVDLGVDDVVLLDGAGAGDAVAETSTAALVWWRGDALGVPADGIPHVPGVTAGALVALATALGVPVVPEHATPDDLDGREIWAVNALHGIRMVTSWPGGPSPAAEPGRFALWRARLDALRRPLPEVARA